MHCTCAAHVTACMTLRYTSTGPLSEQTSTVQQPKHSDKPQKTRQEQSKDSRNGQGRLQHQHAGTTLHVNNVVQP